MSFLSSFAQALVIMVVVALPLFYVARRLRRPKVLIRYAGIAAALALLVAGMEATSRLLVERCMEAGNTGCVDYGAAGGKAMAIGGFAVASWIRARNLWRPF